MLLAKGLEIGLRMRADFVAGIPRLLGKGGYPVNEFRDAGCLDARAVLENEYFPEVEGIVAGFDDGSVGRACNGVLI